MRKNNQEWTTRLKRNETTTAESIEKTVRGIMEGKTGIDQQIEPIYTEKKDGVLPQYDIRTDRFEIARVAKEKLNKYEAEKIAKGENVVTKESDKEKTTEPNQESQE